MIDNNYIEIVEKYFKKESFSMISKKSKNFKNEYVNPGKQYEGSLWDWDSYFSIKALIGICERFKNDKNFDYKKRKESVIKVGKGSINNFLDNQLSDGYIPIVLTDYYIESNYWSNIHFKKNIVNQHKPFLCQSILQISDYSNDYNWYDIEKVINYMDYYDKEQLDKNTGLYIFKSDYMIGIDNNPSVYGLPYGTTGDLYLNCFMYLELLALSKLLEIINDGRSKSYYKKSIDLRDRIVNECYDVKDGLYYSVFLDISNRRNSDLGWHNGMTMHWKTLPIKIRTAITFISMYSKIATKEQAETMIERHLNDPKFYSEHGLRSVANDEKIYSLEATSNPSNSLGPVWMIYNYIAFCGVLNYGRKDIANKICGDMIENFAKDIIENGKTDECYNPDTGKPIMNKSFLSWNSLIILMLNQLKR